MAARGNLGKKWPGIQDLLRREMLDFEAAFTEWRGHGTELASRAVSDGCALIIAMGGDGTIHDVVNGMMNDGRTAAPDVALGIIPCGTGADFVRTLGLAGDMVAAVRHLARTGSSRLIDLGEVTCQAGGQERRRYFINVAGLGLDAEVTRRAGRGRQHGRGTLPYLIALAAILPRCRSKPVSARIDGRPLQANAHSVIIGNGRYFGGGMCVAPHARLDDGLLDVIVLGDYGPLELLWHLPKLYRGTHLGLRKVQAFQVQVVSVASTQRLLLQADGELIGEGPATFRVLPAALRIRM